MTVTDVKRIIPFAVIHTMYAQKGRAENSCPDPRAHDVRMGGDQALGVLLGVEQVGRYAESDLDVVKHLNVFEVSCPGTEAKDGMINDCRG